MLYIALVTLFFTHNGIHAEDIVEQKPNMYRRKIPMHAVHQGQPLPFQMFGDRRDNVVGSQVYQNGMTFNVDADAPNNIFGAYTEHVNQNFKFVGNPNSAQPNGGGIQFGSSTVQLNNRYINSKDARNFGRPRRYRSGDWQSKFNAQTQKKAQNYAESQAHLAERNSSRKQ